MSRRVTDIAVNPFEDDVVREPRDVSFSVRGLNDAPLSRLNREFSALDGGPPPRKPARAKKAQLVVSPDRGYGKSHLLGRLFGKLGRRATKVYLRPFQDPFKAWHSILLLTLQELEQPDEARRARSSRSPSAPSPMSRPTSSLTCRTTRTRPARWRSCASSAPRRRCRTTRRGRGSSG
ncbi:hypothetical protein [Rhodoplanes elegans]|uniref:hypothetical protein n=1 Tax=Rhodoplanes elegans TaxID=29408 RepID=UPI001AEC8965|nr:hypothetical protein [Rhodoplanes elegans]